MVFVSWARREKDAIISAPEELGRFCSERSDCAEVKQFCNVLLKQEVLLLHLNVAQAAARLLVLKTTQAEVQMLLF